MFKLFARVGIKNFKKVVPAYCAPNFIARIWHDQNCANAFVNTRKNPQNTDLSGPLLQINIVHNINNFITLQAGRLANLLANTGKLFYCHH